MNKYVVASLIVVFGSALIAGGLYFTHNALCLWAFVLVGAFAHDIVK